MAISPEIENEKYKESKGRRHNGKDRRLRKAKSMARNEQDNGSERHRFVSLKTLAKMIDAHRTSIHRWLSEAGIEPVAIGQGRRGAIRYRWSDVQGWLDSLEAA